MDQRGPTADGGVGQLHSSYATVEQSLPYWQKLVFIGHPDARYDADLSDRLCQLALAQRSARLPGHKMLDTTSALAKVLTLAHLPIVF